MSVAIRKAIKIYGCWIPEHPIPNAIKPKEAPPRNRLICQAQLKSLLKNLAFFEALVLRSLKNLIHTGVMQ